MTRLRIKRTHFFAYLAASVFCLSISGQAIAVDDGARAYWKMRDGSHVVSAQYLNLDLQATGAQSFDPSGFIYPNADAEADIFLLTYAHHFTLFDRPSSVAFNLVGGSVDVSVNTLLARRYRSCPRGLHRVPRSASQQADLATPPCSSMSISLELRRL